MDESTSNFIWGMVLAYLLSGFFFSDDVRSVEIEKSYEICLPNDGLKKIESYVLSDTVVCNNGAEFVIDLKNLVK